MWQCVYTSSSAVQPPVIDMDSLWVKVMITWKGSSATLGCSLGGPLKGVLVTVGAAVGAAVEGTGGKLDEKINSAKGCGE